MNHLGFDQHGKIYWNLGPYPRKVLLERFGRKRADKMYRDPHARHVGWIVAGHWIEVYGLVALSAGKGKVTP